MFSYSRTAVYIGMNCSSNTSPRHSGDNFFLATPVLDAGTMIFVVFSLTCVRSDKAGEKLTTVTLEAAQPELSENPGSDPVQMAGRAHRFSPHT